MNLKLLKRFFNEYIDLIKIIFYQTLLVGIFVVSNINYLYLFAILLIFYWLIFLAKSKHYLPILLIFLAVSLSLNALRSNSNGVHYKNLLNETDGYGEFTLLADDILYVESELVDNSSFISCKIENLKLNIDDDFRKAEGKVLLFRGKIPDKSFKIGTKFRVIGNLNFVEEINLFNGGGSDINYFGRGSYKKYLNNLGIYAIIYPENNSCEILCDNNWSILKVIASCRDWVLNKSLRYIKDKEVRNTAAALFFGCKGALNSKWKSDFVKSGTIHLFAVSGMHVSMLFLFLMISFSFLSFRKRYLFALLPIFVFTIATGANIPALRAFIMILCFVLCKGALLRLSNINTILVSATLLILWNPYNLIDVGFLYSFVITTILLLLSDFMRDVYHVSLSDKEFIPERVRYLALDKKLIWKVVYVLSGCLFAFLSGSVISLYFFGSAYLISLLVNGVLMFLMSFITLLMFLSGILSICAWSGNWISFIFEKVMRCFLNFCEMASSLDSNISIPRFDIFELICFYGFLFTLLIGRRGRSLLVSLIWLILLIISVSIADYNQKSGVLLVKNAEQQLEVCIYEGGIKYAILYNPSDFDDVQLFSNFLASRAIKRLDYVIVDKLNSKNVKTLNGLSKNLYICNLISFAETQRNEKKLLNNLSEKLHSKFYIESAGNSKILKNLQYFNEKSQIKLEYFNNATNFKLIINYDKNSGRLELDLNGRKIERTLLKSSLTEIYNYEL